MSSAARDRLGETLRGTLDRWYDRGAIRAEAEEDLRWLARTWD